MSAAMLRRAAQTAVILGLAGTVLGVPWPYALVAGVLLVFHVVTRYRATSPAMSLATSLVTAVTFPVCLEAAGAGAAAILAVLPVLPGVEAALLRLAAAQRSRTGAVVPRDLGPLPGFPGRASTPLLRTLLLIAAITTAVGLVAGREVVAASGIIVGVWPLALAGVVLLRMPAPFAKSAPVQVRAVAGAQIEATALLTPATQLDCLVGFSSAVAWGEVQPSAVRIGGEQVPLRLTLTPPLAGPSTLHVDAAVVDPWGLTVTRQSVDAAGLRIIPRARYAGWLAQRYLEQTRPDAVSTPAVTAPRRDLRGGMEYRGARTYTPGDSLRAIDWKHTAKLRTLIVKDFQASGAQTAVLLVDLEALDPDSVDRLAHQVIVTALTLAQEGVPMVLAGYTGTDVTRVTSVLAPRTAVQEALTLIESITISVPLRRSFEPPVLGRLRRMRAVLTGASASSGLARVLGLEIQALLNEARTHPGAQALRRVLEHCRPPAAIINLSVAGERNAPLEVALGQLRARGYEAATLNGARTGARDRRPVPLGAPGTPHDRGA